MEQQNQVLVIDDEPKWCDKLAEILEQTGYQVCKAHTYEEALEWLNRQPFHLAVVDVNLADASTDKQGEPGDTSGLGFIKEVRGRAMNEHMSVIIVTGFGTFKVAREAFKRLRVYDVILKKEFKLDNFKSVVADAIARTHADAPRETP